MTKYKEYFQKMLEDHKDAFNAFRDIHDKYKNNEASQEEYNTHGKPIMDLIREYEDKLCRQSEGSGYAAYAGNLAEKFWEEIRREFPLIDRVGVIIKKVAVEPPVAPAPALANDEEEFTIKKIEMFDIKKIRLN